MKKTFQILVIFLFIFLAACKRKATKTQTAATEKDTVSIHHPSDNNYMQLRSLALNIKAGDLQLTLPANETIVFGVVMDWNVSEGVVTLATFKTGDASLYFSIGGGMIGGVGHENVARASKQFVAASQNFLHLAVMKNSDNLPLKDEIQFYFLTNKGTFFVHENIAAVEQNNSALSALFTEANNVITEMRSIEENAVKQ